MRPRKLAGGHGVVEHSCAVIRRRMMAERWIAALAPIMSAANPAASIVVGMPRVRAGRAFKDKGSAEGEGDKAKDRLSSRPHGRGPARRIASSWDPGSRRIWPRRVITVGLMELSVAPGARAPLVGGAGWDKRQV